MIKTDRLLQARVLHCAMRLPDFIVIGAPKAGTTSLCDYLSARHDIHIFEGKEARFFTTRFEQGIEWYASLFSKAESGQLVGEGTPGYAIGPNTNIVSERIKTHVPSAKLIYMVRHPIERIKSHYVQRLANGHEDIGLSQAVMSQKLFVETSKYNDRLADYLHHFPAEQIHIIFFEDLMANTQKVLSECLTFLGADQTAQTELAKRGARETRARDSKTLDRMKKSKLIWALRPLAPKGLVDRIRPYFKSKVDLDSVDLTLNADALAFVKSALRDDTKAFLDRMNKPSNYWEI